jgi:hypothetical protein
MQVGIYIFSFKKRKSKPATPDDDVWMKILNSQPETDAIIQIALQRQCHL